MSHPSTHDRSLAEPTLIKTLNYVIDHGATGERQLAQLCKDLIELAGGQPNVKHYIDYTAVQVLDESDHPWG